MIPLSPTNQASTANAEHSPNQLAVVVAQYAELLRDSPWVDGTSASQLFEHANRLSSVLWDGPEVVAFARLVSRASQIRALGN